MPEITANDGVRLHYEEKGRGRPLVMIHGWTFSGRFFVRNAEALAEHFRVITVDLRGHGDSDKPAHGYRVPRLARDLYDLLEKLDLEDVTVVGWSSRPARGPLDDRAAAGPALAEAVGFVPPERRAQADALRCP